MAFTASQAFDLLRTAFSRNRLPHALLIVGDEHQGASRLILQLLELMNGIRADHLDSVRDEYCRLVRPKSKSRRILRDDIRAVEPFLQQRAAEGKWKIAVFMDAERMNDEAANAFLKTLEEPPSQCLLILSTSQPDQLLQTIISRCVRVNLLQSAEFRLTPIQEALLPHLLEGPPPPSAGPLPQSGQCPGRAGLPQQVRGRHDGGQGRHHQKPEPGPEG